MNDDASWPRFMGIAFPGPPPAPKAGVACGNPAAAAGRWEAAAGVGGAAITVAMPRPVTGPLAGVVVWSGRGGGWTIGCVWTKGFGPGFGSRWATRLGTGLFQRQLVPHALPPLPSHPPLLFFAPRDGKKKEKKKKKKRNKGSPSSSGAARVPEASPFPATATRDRKNTIPTPATGWLSFDHAKRPARQRQV